MAGTHSTTDNEDLKQYSDDRSHGGNEGTGNQAGGGDMQHGGDGTQAGGGETQQGGGDHAGSGLSEQDVTFAKEAAASGLAEVKLGELAAEKGSDADVRSFGQEMVTDHTQANQELAKIAQDLGIDLPQQLDEQHQALAETLSKLSGSEFDVTYMESQVEDHQTAVALFEKEAEQGQNETLVQYAENNLPLLEHHLQEATDILDKLQGSTDHEGGSSDYSSYACQDWDAYASHGHVDVA